MTTLYRFSLNFYRTVLWIVIPFYFILFLASGHEFQLNIRDFGWLVTAGIALTLTYFIDLDRDKRETIIFKIIFGTILTLTLVGSIILFLGALQFKYGEDAQGMRLLSYIVPLIFAACDIVVIIGLFRKKQ